MNPRGWWRADTQAPPPLRPQNPNPKQAMAKRIDWIYHRKG